MCEVVRWLHLVRWRFFVGGRLVLAAAVVPAVRGIEGRARATPRSPIERRGRTVKIAPRVPITPGMDLQDQLTEHLGVDSDLTAEQAAQILVGAAGYARDALHALDECTHPELDPTQLAEILRRAATIEAHLGALHRLTVEVCANWPIGNIPGVVKANLELAERCRTLIQQRRADVEHEVMILRAPLAAYARPC